MANSCKMLKICVRVPQSCSDKYKELFRSTIEFNDSLSLDFNTLIKAFDMLFPTNKIVEFIVQ